jgi:hypothetical protein
VIAWLIIEDSFFNRLFKWIVSMDCANGLR